MKEPGESMGLEVVINPCDDLGFVCDENVFSCCLGARNHILFCHLVMHNITSDGELLC
jgi:hypothetical protein